MDSRGVISQACGILRERHGLDSTATFTVFSRLSSTMNVKMRVIASELVATGKLPSRSARHDED